MTVYVNIWLGALRNPDDWTGHTSLAINSEWYISSWPGITSSRKKSLGDRPNRWRLSLDDDISKLGRQPDHRIIIHNLDEKAIMRYWDDIYFGTRFNLINHNCSTVVAHALQVGSGQRPTGSFWYPTQVMRLARRLA
jgi:hypothetical protein